MKIKGFSNNIELAELGNLCIFSQGEQITKRDTTRTWKEGYVRYLYISDFSSDRKVVYVRDEYPTKKVSEETIIMGNTGAAGVVCRGKSGVLCNNAFIIKIKESKKRTLNNEFLWQYLNSEYKERQLKRLMNPAGQPHVGHKNITKLNVPIIPFSEQEKIAGVLGCWDLGIERLEKLIDAKRKMKKALMQQLLAGKKRFKEFKEPWKKVSLRHIFNQITEKVTEQLTTLSITAGVGFVSQEEKFGKDISGKQYQNYILVKTDDFCYNKGFSKTYNQGCVYKLTTYKKAAAPSAFISFRRNNDDVYDDFYQQWFMADYHAPQLKRYITSGARSDGLINLNKSDFFSISVPLPSLPEQQKIASVLNTADREIELLCDKLEALKNQKKGLMQKLLTGKIRVKV